MTQSILERDSGLALAIEHHMGGRLDEAERLYLRLHEQNSQDEEVLYLLGVLCCDLGVFDTACRFLSEAITTSPHFAEATQQLVVAFNGMAEQQAEQGQLKKAEATLRKALQLMPNAEQTLCSLGRLALRRGDAVAAQMYFEQAIQHPSNREEESSDTYNFLGLALLQQGCYAEAEVALRKSLALDQSVQNQTRTQTQARNNLGLALHHQSQFKDAVQCFEEALLHDPDYSVARINLANTLRLIGRHEEARQHLEKLLTTQPEVGDMKVEVLNNLGTVLQDMGCTDEALVCLERAEKLTVASSQEISAQVRWNLALTQLLLGDFKQGWPNYEYRWQGCGNLRGAYKKPLERAWRGESLQGKRLLLWAEQGFGDTLQFIRFAAPLAKMGATVVVEAPATLMALLRLTPGVAEVVLQSNEPTSSVHYDVHCPLLSVPHWLCLNLDSVPATPYLFADPEKSMAWKPRLAGFSGHRVGVVWAGNSRKQSAELAAIDARRSVQLKALAPLFTNERCCFFSLQKVTTNNGQTGGINQEIIDAGLQHVLHDFSAEWVDFSDTAAFIDNLDIVISVDTAVAHLAAGMGKRVWLLNRHDSCWRWLRERQDSPWYPSLRQFRQTKSGDWGEVVSRMDSALQYEKF